VTGDPIEAELKFEAAGEAALDLLAGVDRLGRALLGRPHAIEELDRYLDTPDGRLAAARWACRLRTRGSTTSISLKGPARHAAGDRVHLRPELEGPATAQIDPAAWPPSDARSRLLELAGGGPLVERIALRQRRIERAVRIGPAHVGTLSLDRCRVVLNAGVRRFNVVELELNGAQPDALVRDLEAALAEVDGLRAASDSKLEHALAMLEAGGR